MAGYVADAAEGPALRAQAPTDPAAVLERELTMFTRKALWRVWTTGSGGEPGVDHVTYPYLALITVQGPLRVADLAKLFGVDKSTASRHLAKLCSAGLIQAEADPSDARSQPMRATPMGTEILLRLQSQRAAWLQQALAGWETEDQLRLAGMMARLNADLDAS
jgi:DNA-binding MarR family transcriptional regulator